MRRSSIASLTHLLYTLVQLSHIVQSFTLGRPPGFTLAHIDCKKPCNEVPNRWKHRFTSECMNLVYASLTSRPQASGTLAIYSSSPSFQSYPPLPPSQCLPYMSPSRAPTSPQKTPPRARRSASVAQPVSSVQNVIGPFIPYWHLPRRPQSDPCLLQAQAPL